MSQHQFRRILFLIFLVHTSGLNAQNVDEATQQIWIDFLPHFDLTERLSIYGDVSSRFTLGHFDQTYVIRPSIKFNISSIISANAGFGVFYRKADDLETSENRPWLGTRLSWPDIGPLRFKQYLRVENRNFNDRLSNSRFQENRLRYQIGTKLPLNKTAIQDEAFYIPLAFEWLGTDDKSAGGPNLDQLRMTLGLGHVFNKVWLLEMVYMNWWNKSAATDSFEPSNQVIRIRLHYRGWVIGE
ncbi:MAG: DUF2490 domain-containing protein [Vicingaceae bacterium]